MGQIQSLCGDNVFEQLQKEYGDTFVQFIVAEKSKQLVTDKFGEFSKSTTDIFSGFQTKTTTIVDQHSQGLKNIFDQTKAKVDQIIPGGIPAFEKMNGKSINDASGYNALQGRINQIKSDTFQRIDGQRNNVIGEISAKKTGMLQNIDSKKPKLPIYEDLPQPVKSAIIQEGETAFADQISKNQDTILKQVTSQFNPNNVSSLFSTLNPDNMLQNLVGGAAGQFLNNLGLGNIGNFIGGGGSGGLGGIASNFLR